MKAKPVPMETGGYGSTFCSNCCRCITLAAQHMELVHFIGFTRM